MKWWLKRTKALPPDNFNELPFDAMVNLTRSYDGHQREAAVRELMRRDDPRAIAALLVCAGDWVPQVRMVAQRGLRAFLRDECIDQWAVALPELGFLQRVRRTELGDILAAVEQFLVPHAEALTSDAPVLDKAMRRWLFTLRLKQAPNDIDRAVLLCAHVSATDLPIAQLCIHAAHRQPLPQRREVLEAAMHSRLPKVRITATRDLLRLPGFDAQTLRQLCFDRSAAVRTMAANTLIQEQTRGEVLARAQNILQTASASASLQVAALHLLSLLDRVQALDVARDRVAAPAPAVRRLARALRLAVTHGPPLDEELLATLADPSSKVRKLAVQLVRSGAPLPETRRLIRWAAEQRTTAPEVVAMLRCASPWDRLQFLLELLDYGPLSEELANLIGMEMLAWTGAVTSCYVAPDNEQRARLASLWSRKDALLSQAPIRKMVPHGFVAEAEFHLKAFAIV